MIFGSLLFFFEGNFEGESPGLVSELGSTELAAGQPPPVSERHPPRAAAPAQRRRGSFRMTLAALGQESGIIGYPIRRECDEVCGEMEVRRGLTALALGWGVMSGVYIAGFWVQFGAAETVRYGQISYTALLNLLLSFWPF